MREIMDRKFWYFRGLFMDAVMKKHMRRLQACLEWLAGDGFLNSDAVYGLFPKLSMAEDLFAMFVAIIETGDKTYRSPIGKIVSCYMGVAAQLARVDKSQDVLDAIANINDLRIALQAGDTSLWPVLKEACDTLRQRLDTICLRQTARAYAQCNSQDRQYMLKQREFASALAEVRSSMPQFREVSLTEQQAKEVCVSLVVGG